MDKETLITGLSRPFKAAVPWSTYIIRNILEIFFYPFDSMIIDGFVIRSTTKCIAASHPMYRVQTPVSPVL